MLEALLDSSPFPIQVLDIDARARHETPAFQDLVNTDPEAPRLRAAIAAAARQAAALRGRGVAARAGLRTSWAMQCVQTAADEYRLYVALFNDPLTAESSIVVAVQPMIAPLGPTSAAQKRFRLTKRESQVARLLAAGLSNPEIAKTLGRSIHTARRHAESVLAKLGVASRTRVAVRLRVS